MVYLTELFLFLYWMIKLKSYCFVFFKVVRELTKYTNHFRILALSATPGSDIKVSKMSFHLLKFMKIRTFVCGHISFPF